MTHSLRLCSLELALDRLNDEEATIELEWDEVRIIEAYDGADIEAGLICEWRQVDEIIGRFAATFAVSTDERPNHDAVADCVVRHIWPAWRLLAEHLHGLAGHTIRLPLELPDGAREYLMAHLASAGDQ